jgi:hypothetical protein
LIPLVLVAVLAGLGTGVLIAKSSLIGAGLLVVLVAATLAIRRPVYVAIFALLCVFAVQRLGSGAISVGAKGGVTYSDAALALAAGFALPALIRTPEIARLRTAGIGLGIYLVSLLPSLIVNQAARADVEWIHRLVMVGGGMLVGAWIVRAGAVRLALRSLTGVGAVVALLAIENTVRHGLSPATPLGLNKNLVGALLGGVIVIVLAAGSEAGLGRTVQACAGILLAGGLIASQSRGGMLAAATGLLVAYLVNGSATRTKAGRALPILVGVTLAVFAALSVHSQLHQTAEQARHGSIETRVNVENETRKIWRTSPVVGVGLKYFVSGKYGALAQAPNVDIDNELAESGVIGLAGYIAFQGTVIGTGIRRRKQGGALVAVGVGVVTGQLVHGMVDIYWSAGVVTLPFIILGIGLATVRDPDGRTPRTDPLGVRVVHRWVQPAA